MTAPSSICNRRLASQYRCLWPCPPSSSLRFSILLIQVVIESLHFLHYGVCDYIRTSLSRTRLFRVTAYLEVKIWSLFQHETMTAGTCNKIMWKSGEIAPPLFHIILFIYIFLTSGVKLHIHLLNVVVQFIVFLTLSTLICRSTDISKCFSESLGIRDNGSRLYLYFTMMLR